MKYKSLKTRVLIWFGSIISIIFILFSIGFYYFYNQSVITSIQSKLYKEALFIQDKIQNNTPIDQIVSDPSLTSSQILILKDEQVLYKTSHFKLENIKKYTTQKSLFSTIDKGEFLSAVFTLKFNKPYNGTILLIQDDIDDKVENIVDTMLLFNPILLFLILFLANKLIDKILIPIKEIADTSKNININQLTTKIDQQNYKHNDEIKELIHSFNDMTQRLQNEFEKVERFNSDVSHELKTPLTIIKGEISVTLRKLREPKEYQKSLQTIATEVNNMQELVDDLLLLIQYSKENIKDSFTLLDMDSILLMTLEKYDKSIKEKNINLHLDRIEPIEYLANAQLITVVFSNIIDNAIKYTENGKNIYISLFKEGDTITFSVKDEGIGIPKESLSKVTDRFYRVDQSRNKSIKGFGLGLSLVKNIVELHNATIQIRSKEATGTTITIQF